MIWEIIRRHGKILFVCTKKQGAEIVKEVAAEAKQYYVTNKTSSGITGSRFNFARIFFSQN
ncbi:MAG: 30S ribosomal protein S2 [Bacteroidia bacterium]|nr:30S ribosomal protein S2 [Bacteroidia bacterium]